MYRKKAENIYRVKKEGKYKMSKVIALIGNPNSGKTTLFNALTGSTQTVGNWPGVTVEKKSGILHINDTAYEIVDLPGIYSFTAYSIDETIARDFIIHQDIDLIIDIVDVTNLERNLYLTTQLIELRKPMLVCLNMIDIAEKTGLDIDVNHLSQFLGCPVLPVSAFKKTGIEEIKSCIKNSTKDDFISQTKIPYDNIIVWELDKLTPAIVDIADKYSVNAGWIAIKLIENDTIISNNLTPFIQGLVADSRDRIQHHTGNEPEIMTAEGRYAFIKGICREIIKHRPLERLTYSDKIDKLLLHPLIGLPVFALVMFVIFSVSISLSQPIIAFFDSVCGWLFVEETRHLLGQINSPEWLTFFISDALGGGLQAVATFVPPIFFIFFILSILEDSGYMARVAFIMDKFMHWLGLSGKSIIPMVVGFGCTVPAIMAARTLDNKRDRLMTILLVPFSSCGAKIPVYIMFAMIFFPDRAGLVIFLLYLTGIVLALISGQILKRLVFTGQSSDFVMELPAYHIPTVNGVFLHTWHRLQDFILRAGKTILIAIVILTLVTSIPVRKNAETGERESALAVAGQFITPIFYPMGIERDNWAATVALISGFFAKEAIVGSFEALQSKDEVVKTSATPHKSSTDSVRSLPKIVYSDTMGVNSVDFKDNPPLELPKNSLSERLDISQSSEDIVQKVKPNFRSIHQVIAYLLFILIYTPCLAAMAVVHKEVSLLFAIVQSVFLTSLGWAVATIYYNIMNYTHLSFIWFSIAALVFGGLLFMFKLIDLIKE